MLPEKGGFGKNAEPGIAGALSQKGKESFLWGPFLSEGEKKVQGRKL